MHSTASDKGEKNDQLSYLNVYMLSWAFEDLKTCSPPKRSSCNTQLISNYFLSTNFVPGSENTEVNRKERALPKGTGVQV